MTDAIREIRQGFRSTCVADSLERGECSISLDGTPEPRLLVDLDKPGSPLDQNSVRCDYLVFAVGDDSAVLVAPVEFKGRWRKGMEDQLQAGADVAETRVPSGSDVGFRPVAALRRFNLKAQRPHVRRKVTFRGGAEPVRVVLCGDRLASAITT